MKKKDFLGIRELPRSEIEWILERSKKAKQVFLNHSSLETGLKSDLEADYPKVLRGKKVVNLFYEPSTRTKLSFEMASRYLGAELLNVNTPTSSIVKGESLMDTAKTLEAMQVDMVVLRHHHSGSAHFLSQKTQLSVINAGDGIHEHPSQTLLDLFTILERKGRIDGLKVVLVGDLLHSRVSRSNILGLLKMGAEVRVLAPKTLVPRELERLGCFVYYHMEEALYGADVLYSLRIQMERDAKYFFPSLQEYIRLYGIYPEHIQNFCSPQVLLMHPGPINRGIELSPELAYSENSSISDQVTHGIAVRMAIFEWVARENSCNHQSIDKNSYSKMLASSVKESMKN